LIFSEEAEKMQDQKMPDQISGMKTARLL